VFCLIDPAGLMVQLRFAKDRRDRSTSAPDVP
jgi:hypothetical protein